MRKLFYFLLFVHTLAVQAENGFQAGEKQAAGCAACHGVNGVSVNPAWPSLAGQHVRYLVKQLHDFKSGARQGTVMGALVASLSDQDMADLALFYSQQPRPQGKTPRRFVARGEVLYRGGDFDKHITACIACHGPNASGNEQAGFPLLSGQQVGYNVAQLQQFKDKQRTNDLNGIMRDISARMSLEDMENVANYMYGLH